uniref:Transmembrane protein n=1 Tax=Noccaea caerulescens TaxID=107243 RepID=A0A1J3DDL0_NOCCA
MESQKQEREVRKMKKVTKIIALASIFSFILSYSSLTSSLQQRLHLASMLVDKKYMFLLCNGIVAFIMRNFETLLHGNAINIVEETKEEKIKDMRKSEVKKVVALLGEQSASKEEEEEEEEESVDLLRGEGEEEEENTLVNVEDDDGMLVQDLALIRIDDDDDDDDNSFLSSEDLNKKCEDFIRKVKAEIRLESRKLTNF